MESKSVPYGWYLIKEVTPGHIAAPSAMADHAPVSLVLTSPVTGNVEIDLKPVSPESHKNIVEADGSQQRKADDFAQNTTINYQFTYYVPAGWARQYSTHGFWFQMNNQLSNDLTFDNVTGIKIGDAFDSTMGEVDWNLDAPASQTPATAGNRLNFSV